MPQVLTLIEPMSSVAVRPYGREKWSDSDYWAFCEANRKLHLECTSEGEILILPPTGAETAYRNTLAMADLANWATEDGSGKSFGSGVQYFLPDGSGLSPDASWVSNESLQSLTKQERKKLLRLTPEFVVEVLPETDTLREGRPKPRWNFGSPTESAWLG